MFSPHTGRKARRGSFEGILHKNTIQKTLAQRRCSAPSLVFNKALSKPRSTVRESNVCSISIEQCPFVLGLTSEDSELILHESVKLTQDLKTKERYLFLFSDMIIIAKLKSGTSFRLKHRVDLAEMMALSCEEEDEKEEACLFHSYPKNALLFIWPCNGCIASFRSLEVKELWLDTLVWQIREVGGTESITVPYTRLLMKVLTGCNASKAINTSNMEGLIDCPTEADAKKYQLLAAMINEDGMCHLIENNKKRKAVISWPFTFRRSSTLSETSVSPELKATLFDQPLSIVCEEDALPKPILGPSTEGIFRKAANEKTRKELKEDLNSGKTLDLKSKPVHLLAVVLKDFLRGIPNQLLSSELYHEWMAALEKPTLEKRTENMKCVADKLPRPNWILLQHLICVLHHISKASTVNKMDSNNLAVCIGPNMLQPRHDKILSLEAQKQANDRVITLVEFFIDNCFDLFDENISQLISTTEKDSLEDTDVSEITFQQNDSAYDSTDPEHEGHASTLTSYQEDLGMINSGSEALKSSMDHDINLSESSISLFKVSSMGRRKSEPHIVLSRDTKVVEGRKLNRSHDDVTVCKSGAPSTKEKLTKQVLDIAFYKNKMPRGLTVNTSYSVDVLDDVLQNALSSCSLESSFSDCSVFTSSPLASPISPKNSCLIRHQSCSLKSGIRTDLKSSSREIKKHSKSFSYVNNKKMLAKTQSWGPEGQNPRLQRNVFNSSLRNRNQYENESPQAKSFQQPAVVRLRRPQSARKMSVDEVFRMVDQRNPGKPPSYEEAIHKNVPPFKGMTVQTMRATVSNNEFSSSSDIPMDSTYRERRTHDYTIQTTINEGSMERNCSLQMQQLCQYGKTKSVLIRSMSESVKKHKHETLNRRCSQPFELYDQIQYAKESYV
ncbi:T-cell activation Rho GTPase-activating protein isoform X2 [Xenopus laevis]|uniref:T-cell activation Rho GTPase-activating protein n=1 Tax=Xenopus laevis TaxID=8355 RepID=A0A8J1KN76_XENLA|nr:T-cell activation Rho GTPase-activating protein isoform X2 [Xenopus laevis]